MVREETARRGRGLRRRRRDGARRSAPTARVRGARARVRRRHRPRRADRRQAPTAQGRPTALVTTNVAVHSMFKGVDRDERRRRRQHHHRPVRRRLVVADPVQGRRHLGRHGVREELHQGQSRRCRRRRCIDQAHRAAARTSSSACATPSASSTSARRATGPIARKSVLRRSAADGRATPPPSSIRCSRRACCSRSTAPSSPPSTSTARSPTAISPPSASRYQEQCIARHGHLQGPGARVLLARTCASCSFASAHNPDHVLGDHLDARRRRLQAVDVALGGAQQGLLASSPTMENDARRARRPAARPSPRRRVTPHTRRRQPRRQ